jgi:hypothetical protein
MYNLFGVDENTVQIISNYAFINDILWKTACIIFLAILIY